MRPEPGQCHPGDAQAALAREVAERCHPGQVARGVHAAVVERARDGDAAARLHPRAVQVPVRQDPAGQRGERRVANALAGQQRQQVFLVASVQQAQAVLDPLRAGQAGPVRRAQQLLEQGRVHVAHTERADQAGVPSGGERLEGLGERGLRIRDVGQVEVNPAESLDTACQLPVDVPSGQVGAPVAGIGHAAADLALQQDVLRLARTVPVAHGLLARAAGVGVRGVDDRDAKRAGLVQPGQPLVVGDALAAGRGRAPDAADPARAEDELADLDRRPAETNDAHDNSPLYRATVGSGRRPPTPAAPGRSPGSGRRSRMASA